jgi:hypothetical protein
MPSTDEPIDTLLPSHPFFKAPNTTTLMKLTSLLLATALLWASHVPASGQLRNVTDNAAGISYNANSKTVLGTYTAGKDDHTILANAAAAAFTITLPAPSSRANPYLVIKKIDATANAVTLDPFGAATIDGASTVSLTAQYQTVILHASPSGWHVLGNPGSTTNSGTYTQTSASAAAFASGPNGNTNPVFRLVNNITSAATGISVTGRAEAAGVDITVLSSGTNESLFVNAKGSGTILLNGTATGAVLVGDATNPAFGVTHTTEGTGWNITSAAAASGVSLTVTSSGTNESGTIDAKGTGTLTLNGTATGAVLIPKGRVTPSVETIAGDGAITIQSGTVLLTKGSAAAITLAAPSAQDGTIIEITSTTDFEHVVTVTGGLWDGTATTNTTITFPAVAGGAVRIIAFGTDWYVLSNQGTTIAP